MSLALFDLDNTLLDGDSEICWLQFLASRGLCDYDVTAVVDDHKTKYAQGVPDTAHWQEVLVSPILSLDSHAQASVRDDFMTSIIQPIVRQPMADVVKQHHAKGHRTIIVTAANHFLAQPMQTLFGVDDLIATDLVTDNGQLTAQIKGTACFREGKIVRVNELLGHGKLTESESWFYSDSHNDLPLLECVTHPVAVTPDNELLAKATQMQWQIIH